MELEGLAPSGRENHQLVRRRNGPVPMRLQRIRLQARYQLLSPGRLFNVRGCSVPCKPPTSRLPVIRSQYGGSFLCVCHNPPTSDCIEPDPISPTCRGASLESNPTRCCLFWSLVWCTCFWRHNTKRRGNGCFLLHCVIHTVQLLYLYLPVPTP